MSLFDVVKSQHLRTDASLTIFIKRKTVKKPLKVDSHNFFFKSTPRKKNFYNFSQLQARNEQILVEVVVDHTAAGRVGSWGRGSWNWGWGSVGRTFC